MNDIRTILGNKIRKYRELNNLPQEKLAEIIGIGVPALSRLECGKSYPTYETLNKIISYFKIEPFMLFEDVNYGSENDNYNEIVKRLNIIKNNNEKIKTLLEFIKILT